MSLEKIKEKIKEEKGGEEVEEEREEESPHRSLFLRAISVVYACFRPRTILIHRMEMVSFS
jgi:hypothetical protein